MDIYTTVRVLNVKASKNILFILFEDDVDVNNLLLLCDAMDSLGYCLDILVSVQSFELQ